MATIKAMPTYVRGIQFRSRTEAAWYVFFDLLDLRPIYEPCVFELELFVCEKESERKINYTPDFLVTDYNGIEHYVEVKGELHGENEDIGKACVLGCSRPTWIIVGSTYMYSLIQIVDRHKYNKLFFDVISEDKLVFVEKGSGLITNCPDENNWRVSDEDLKKAFLPKDYELRHTHQAWEAWNETQYRKPA